MSGWKTERFGESIQTLLGWRRWGMKISRHEKALKYATGEKSAKREKYIDGGRKWSADSVRAYNILRLFGQGSEMKYIWSLLILHV